MDEDNLKFITEYDKMTDMDEKVLDQMLEKGEHLASKFFEVKLQFIKKLR